jgi:hypothetical protein
MRSCACRPIALHTLAVSVLLALPPSCPSLQRCSLRSAAAGDGLSGGRSPSTRPCVLILSCDSASCQSQSAPWLMTMRDAILEPGPCRVWLNLTMSFFCCCLIIVNQCNKRWVCQSHSSNFKRCSCLIWVDILSIVFPVRQRALSHYYYYLNTGGAYIKKSPCQFGRSVTVIVNAI